MEKPFRLALHQRLPKHLLALHSTDMAHSATPAEIPHGITRQIQDTVNQQEIPTKYHEIFYTGRQILLWLPEEKTFYHNFIKNIRAEAVDRQAILINERIAHRETQSLS